MRPLPASSNAEPTRGTDRRIYGYYYYYILNIFLYFNYVDYYFEIPVNEFYEFYVKRHYMNRWRNEISV